MKQFLAAVLILLASVSATAREISDEVSISALSALINEYRGEEGFEVVKVGRLGTAGIKSIIRASGDGDSKEVMQIIRGINKFIVIDFDDCRTDVKNQFRRKAERLLNDENLILEAKEDGQKVKIYGVVSNNANTLRDFVLYVPDEGAMICAFGSISLSALASAM